MNEVNVKTAGGLITNNGLRLEMVSVSIQGTAHIAQAVENQDAVALSFQNGYGLAAVADGLGSCVYSARGASLATATALESLGKLFACPDRLYCFDPRVLASEIINNWKCQLQTKDILSHDTTLQLAGIGSDLVILGGIGDGLIQISISEGNGIEILEDRKEFFNYTDSLSTQHSEERFKVVKFLYRDKDLPLTVVLATDGVAADMVPQRRSQLAWTLGRMLREKGRQQTASELQHWLLNWPALWNTDDKSIAVVTLWNEDGKHV